MSVARPARSLLGRCIASTRPSATGGPAVQCRQFHNSTPCAKRRSRFRSIPAEDLGLLNPAKLSEFTQQASPDYSPKDRAALQNTYTPQQLEAIEAGESAVRADDMVLQGRLREDPYRPNYVEDFTVMNPKYDLKPETEVTPREPQWRTLTEWVDDYGAKMLKIMEKKTSNQLGRAMIRALKRVKDSKGEEMIDLTRDELEEMERDPELLKRYLVENEPVEQGAHQPASGSGALTQAQAHELDMAIDEAWQKEMAELANNPNDFELRPSNLELLEDGPAGVVSQHSAEAHELGKVPGVAGLYKKDLDPEDAGRDDTGEFQEIKRLTGMSLVQLQSLIRKVLVSRNVHNQTRLGKIRSVSVVAIAGNGNGWLGIGMAKAVESQTASQTAMLLAIRNMKPVRRYENRTIFGDVKAKVSGTVVELFARPPGFGLRCPHRIFEMCRAAGLQDMAARIPRSKNPMNTVKAAYQALMNQPDPEEIAIGRGKKMVDVRKVYYGGAVY
ncbi:hypothetical protein HIM_09479 [Hirsutella minnesotensis 3608]|uniref:Small ribosomal subunit protein uS5m n=1 Tax=Hirsutella minnesotensis 3608 TaxID=1043627 RepID=A0A0F7ZLF5_9HYPO|nr:hypothetical protein HIM_09479 [Hirsutella minnesotensis 3608]